MSVSVITRFPSGSAGSVAMKASAHNGQNRLMSCHCSGERRGRAAAAISTVGFLGRGPLMACDPELLKKVPLFALLDDDETAVLAGQVDFKKFAARERVYKLGDPGRVAYVLISGRVRVSAVDDDHQDVVVDEPGEGEFFGFASMMEQTPHQTAALTLEESACLEVSREDIAILLARKPHAGMDLLTTLGRQVHAAHKLARTRASRNP